MSLKLIFLYITTVTWMNQALYFGQGQFFPWFPMFLFSFSVSILGCFYLTSKPSLMRVCFKAVSSTNLTSTFSCSSKGFWAEIQHPHDHHLTVNYNIYYPRSYFMIEFISETTYLVLPCSRESWRGSLEAENQDRNLTCQHSPTVQSPKKEHVFSW